MSTCSNSEQGGRSPDEKAFEIPEIATFPGNPSDPMLDTQETLISTLANETMKEQSMVDLNLEEATTVTSIPRVALEAETRVNERPVTNLRNLNSRAIKRLKKRIRSRNSSLEINIGDKPQSPPHKFLRGGGNTGPLLPSPNTIVNTEPTIEELMSINLPLSQKDSWADEMDIADMSMPPKVKYNKDAPNLDCSKEPPTQRINEQSDEQHNVAKSVQNLVKKISDLVKITGEMKDKINDLEDEIILLRKSRNVSQETTQKVKKNCPVKIKNVHNKSKDNLITQEFWNQESQLDECDLDMNSEQPMVEEVTEELPKNFEYLKKCFMDQIGIAMDCRQARSIFNFDETLIAKGFERVVVTWQGMFWEHSHDDISFMNLKKDQFSTDGFESWSAKGVKVFRVTKPCRRSKPFAHRFAVIPPDHFRGVCNPLEVGKYYSHIYQTKVLVGGEMRTLRSKLMARELNLLCGTSYHHRKYDLVKKESVDLNGQQFQPLSQLQTVPPYMNFRNPPQINFCNLPQAQPNQPHNHQNSHYQAVNHNYEGNLNNNNNETQKTPLFYNQAFPNPLPPVNKQAHPSLFLPSHQFQGQNQIPFFR